MEPTGTAYTLAELIRTDHKLGNGDLLKLRVKMDLSETNKCGVESVTQYVLEVALEAVDKDENKLRSLLAELEMD